MAEAIQIKGSNKPHWDRLVKKIQAYCNGKVILYFQDGLPIKIESIEGENKDIDLTIEDTD